MAVQPRLASAVMLLRDSITAEGLEVFMVRRVIQSDFMPDVYVFPGGSISADDRTVEQTPGICRPVADLKADPQGRTALGSGIRAAAIREMYEEAGILLAYQHGNLLALNEENQARFSAYRQAFNDRKGSLVEMAEAEHLELATDLLSYCAHWITPEGMPRRFDTHFFLATAPAQQQAAHDQLETSEGIWVRPADALAGYERGEFPLVFATIHQLRDLAAFGSVKEAFEHAAVTYVPTINPVLKQEGSEVRVHLPEDQANQWNVPEHMTRKKEAPAPYTIILAPNPSLMTGPGTNTIILGSGDTGALVIDPAVEDVAHLDAIIEEGTRRGGIRQILITHGHPDHLGGATLLRERLGVPIYAYSRQGVPVADRELEDGATFAVGNDRLRAIYTPGHRFDHHAYLLEKQGTLFAGDLISGITTNVIAPPEGDMQHYLNSLKRLQELHIVEIVPSHGPTIADPQARIKEYIAHRLLREQQVLHALETLPSGVTIAEMVKHIYTDVDPRLHPVAAWSVEAHLIKLEREGVVERQGSEGWRLLGPIV